MVCIGTTLPMTMKIPHLITELFFKNVLFQLHMKFATFKTLDYIYETSMQNDDKCTKSDTVEQASIDTSMIKEYKYKYVTIILSRSSQLVLTVTYLLLNKANYGNPLTINSTLL
jgi:hypothetical protein